MSHLKIRLTRCSESAMEKKRKGEETDRRGGPNSTSRTSRRCGLLDAIVVRFLPLLYALSLLTWCFDVIVMG